MKKKISLKNQKGFTLIEIAIVLVIIGLLIGGVLKGQSMIQNARVKRLVNDMQGMTTAVLAFQDRFRQLPGDYNVATTPADTHVGNHNGLITAAEFAIEDLHLALLVSGSGTTIPDNAYTGTLNVSNIAVGTSTVNFNKVIATNVPAEAAQEIDTKYDDGLWNAGTVQGSAAYATGTVIANFAWIIQ